MKFMKALLALVAVLALGAFALPSMASASWTNPSPPSSPIGPGGTPHSDLSADWTGVQVDNVGDCDYSNPDGSDDYGDYCLFNATSPASLLRPQGLICITSLDVRIYEDGHTRVVGLTVAPGNNAACALIHMTGTGAGDNTTGIETFPAGQPNAGDPYWSDDICEYTASDPHEYWDKINVDFSIFSASPPNTRVPGDLFGRLDGNVGIEVDSFVDSTGERVTALGANEYAFDREVNLHSVETACVWPDLD